jgi:hypothetical protein
MRSLLPLARANTDHATRIATELASARVTTRQLAALWDAYKRANAKQRARIAECPTLFVRVSALTPPDPSAATVLTALRAAEAALGRAAS